MGIHQARQTLCSWETESGFGDSVGSDEEDLIHKLFEDQQVERENLGGCNQSIGNGNGVLVALENQIILEPITNIGPKKLVAAGGDVLVDLNGTNVERQLITVDNPADLVLDFELGPL